MSITLFDRRRTDNNIFDSIVSILGTSTSVKLDCTLSSAFPYYSIRREGVEVYFGSETSFVDTMLDASSSYTYQIFGHNVKGDEAKGPGNTYVFSTTAVHEGTYSETTAYMDSILVSDDATVYYPGTAQEITGAGVWAAFNETIHYLKTYNLDTKMYFWNPFFGDTAIKLGKNGLDPTDFEMSFSGSWVFNSLGAKGNGSNTFATWSYQGSIYKAYNKPNAERGIGITVTDDTGAGSLEVEMGNARTASGGYFIGVNTPAAGGFLVGLGSTRSPSAVSTGKGVSSGFVKNNVVNRFRNGLISNTYTTSSSSISGADVSYVFGCLNEIYDKKYYSSKTMANPFLTNGTSYVEMSAISKGIEMWDNYLGRKTW